MSAPELLDAALDGRVLVYGSLPPSGRDLDLLVRERERRAIEACLHEAGFIARDGQWARFGQCTAEVVELTPAESWGLPAEELADLFAQGHPIEGLRQLVRPAPHHALLIFARRLAADGLIGEKRLARLATAAREPEAWERAAARAGSWDARCAIDALFEWWQSGAIRACSLRAARREHRLRRLRTAKLHQRAASLRGVLRRAPRPGWGAVIAFSGVDGCGKSTQAAALCDTLQRLGYDALTVRTRIAWEDWLWKMVLPLKRLLSRPVRTAADAVTDSGLADDPVHRARTRSQALTTAWTLVITLANAWSQWRLMLGPLARGAIVICDRYALDSIVELRYSYGDELPLRPHRRVLGRLLPAPVRAYLLDVCTETALERKGEWGERWLSRHRDLYLQEASSLGVSVLDGERPLAELCAEIARDVWTSGRL